MGLEKKTFFIAWGRMGGLKGTWYFRVCFWQMGRVLLLKGLCRMGGVVGEKGFSIAH